MYETLFERMASGTTVLTANKRTAQFLRRQFNLQQQATGKTIWPTPDIIPWTAWLKRLYTERLEAFDGAPPRLFLLSSSQEQILWERIVEKSAKEHLLLMPSESARKAMEAGKLIKEWQIEVAKPEWNDYPESRVFLQWAAQFEEKCRLKKWLEGGSLSRFIQEAMQAGQIDVPSQLVLFNFEEITPQQQSFFHALESMGCSVEKMDNPPRRGKAHKVACQDASAEVEMAALWARGLLERGEAERIGIIAADSSAHRAELERVFAEVLHPELPFNSPDASKRLFNLSLGLPLADYPLVNAAFAILQFTLGSLALPDLGRLLRSPFLAQAEEERESRALLDAYLRKQGEVDISREKLAATISYWNSSMHVGKSKCPKLERQLGDFRNAAGKLPASAQVSQWTILFSELLEMIGWPGISVPSSHEYQTLEAWRRLLEQAGQLDSVEGKIPASVALSQLRKMAAGAIFQPEAREAPVQIMGMLEAAGLQFDRIWIMGLSDNAWPAAASPNPFIPLSVQRERKLPHASADRELEFSQMLTRRLLAISEEAILSYPRQEGDRTLCPSPLIKDLQEIDISSLGLAALESYRQMIYESGQVEIFADPMTVPAEEGQPVQGGSRLIERQAACPFSAFAEFRLGAKGLESPSAWIDARDRGTLLHEVMEALWQQLESHEKLCALAPAELANLIGRSVDGAVAALAKRKPGSFQPEFQRLEKERLERLLAEWLEIEKTRSPFQVETREEKRSAKIGGINLRLKADRLDRLEDGRQVVIDYKTGKVSDADWKGERPNAPQLPLYCVTSEKEVAGIAFAQLRRGEAGFKGVTSEAGILPGVAPKEKEPPWEERLAGWREVITHLCHEIKQGRAAVDPKPPLNKSCGYCELKPLCRIHEVRPAEEESPAHNGGEEGE